MRRAALGGAKFAEFCGAAQRGGARRSVWWGRSFTVYISLS